MPSSQVMTLISRHNCRNFGLERVWEYGFNGNSNIVEIYVGYLRKKVDTGERKLIHTVRGAGYVLKSAR
jgi:two-component system OmpR family response regulator